MAALSDFHRTKSGSDRHTSHAAMEQFQDNKWKNFAIQETIHILRDQFLKIMTLPRPPPNRNPPSCTTARRLSRPPPARNEIL